MAFHLGDDTLNTELLARYAKQQSKDLAVSEKARERLKKFRNLVNQALGSGDTYYGINTGFGYLADVSIETSQLEELQRNLVRSHACGVGNYVEDSISRGLLVLRAHTFYLGHTGISQECVDLILECYKNNILPAIPEKGSVGASGDLAPLAHLALTLMGEGFVVQEGKAIEASQALQDAGLAAHQLQAKEGLSLINGTHFMTVIAALAVEEARELAKAADIILALSLDALRGTVQAFDERIHRVRPQHGQQDVAANVRDLFSGPDQIQESHKDCGKVQDPYSFRCAPQVHGASRDGIAYAKSKVDIELNAVTDNPLCFDELDILSGGNFHGQPIALAMDLLAMASAELGSISERRIEKLTNPNMSGLPAFVTKDSGLNSGFMIPHVVAAALVSENKILCHPASVDSIPTSADKEDHVSMGPIAARKAREVNQNVAQILAIELLTACQGIDLIAPLKPGAALEAVYKKTREISASMPSDRSLHVDIKNVANWIQQGGLRQTLEDQGFTVR
ncbi:histidine ammonia-lyase [Pseudobacteriovorax antillogorgiicola]|uniref:Histidine ammonia-lyase n=1 Tax=Pseudobacteriovorax antillogorgiicola TaxID=1513793 RepID=A0A1Y6B4H9_9BACT|nr:histidine ammonia-lyase [Pseudobacteriovorax antillogorgiicola]TCS59293.1 histidine ammonia-lyase [Pseudobacteriovorax antillogorgiicola]SME89673.1 histidine ammonia-lyase [Pseudobacteriovorax antillogorgiicola]